MDLREAIEAATGESEVWVPQPGDYLIGRVLAIRDVQTDLGERRLVEIEDEDSGVPKTVFLTTMLRDRFLEYGIRQGDRIALKYHGKKQNAKGREYHHWTVLVDRAAERAVQRLGALGGAVAPEDNDEPVDEEAPF